MSSSFLPPDWREQLKRRRLAPRPRWVKVVTWIWAGFTALSLLVAVALIALLNNQRFHQYLIRTIESQASESLGVRVQLENFTLHLHSLSVDLYGITVDGASPYANPPLLQVNHVAAEVRIVSILHRAWYLDHLQIDSPVAWVFVDEHGVSNIPTIKSSGNSNTSIFDLGIRHAMLTQGEVYYNNRPSTLDVDLHDVEFQSTFANLGKKYSGKLTYTDGHLTYGNYKPLTHDLVAEFEATPDEFNLTRSTLTIGASKVLLNGALNNYGNPNLNANYDVSLDGKQIAQLLNNPSVPVGTIHTTGSMQYQAAANQPLLNSLVVNGEVASQRLALGTPSIRTVIVSLDGHYSLANGDATLSNLHAGIMGGEIHAQGAMKNIGGDSHGNLSAAVRGVSLADLARAFGTSTSQQGANVSGTMKADATAAWGKTFDDLVAHLNATVQGKLAARQAGVQQVSTSQTPINSQPTANSAGVGEDGMPIDSAVHATYSAKSGELAVEQSYLRTPQTSLTMNGTVSKRSSLQIHLQANDLREVEAIADLFEPHSPDHPAQPLGLAGTATFQGNVQGTTKAPHLTGQFVAQNLQVNGTSWKDVRTGVDLSPSRASLQNATLEPASHGRITLSASAGLSQWSFTKTSPIQVEFQAAQLNIPDIAKLANQQVPVTGSVNAALTLHGTELNPVGNGNVSLTNLVAYDQPVRTAKLTFNGDGQEVHGKLSIELAAGSIQGTASVRPNDKTYTAEVTADGVQLEKLQAVQAKNVNLTGTVGLKAQGQGSFDNPQVSATVQIPALSVQSQKITAINLQMNVADHVGNATLTSSAINTSINAKARVSLTGDYAADASLDTQGIPLQPLLAVYAPDQAADITGQTEVHATLHGPLKNKGLLEAHVRIPVLKVAYGSTIQLAEGSPILADYKNGIVTIQPSSIKGTDTDLQFKGSIPVSGNGPMALQLLGTVNLQLAQLFDPDVKSSGQLKFNLDSHGEAKDADVGGEIDIVDANFISGDLPVGLQHGNGVLKMTKNRLNIASFQGTVGGGTVTAQGGVAYSPSVQFDLGMAAKDIRIVYPQGMRESIDANIRLTGSTDNAMLGGSVDLSDLSFSPGFDLTSFISQFSGGVSTPPSPGLAQNMQLNIAVHSTNDVNLVSRTLSIGGSANLQVRGTAAEPVILGRVNLTNGDIILNGNRFVLNGGTIQFINPSETEPVVNLSLNTNIQQYSIDLRFQGPVDQLHTEYSSDPALPSADIINLLAFGETTEASAADTTPTNQAAESLVASQVSSQVTSRVSKVAGISQLSISPVLAGSSSQGPPGATITVQQRVTGNLFVNFSTNVASTQSQTIQGQYRVSPRVSVSATRDPNGGFGFDALIKKSW
jgi:translocation and assembly module TamB